MIWTVLRSQCSRFTCVSQCSLFCAVKKPFEACQNSPTTLTTSLIICSCQNISIFLFSQSIQIDKKWRSNRSGALNEPLRDDPSKRHELRRKWTWTSSWHHHGGPNDGWWALWYPWYCPEAPYCGGGLLLAQCCESQTNWGFWEDEDRGNRGGSNGTVPVSLEPFLSAGVTGKERWHDGGLRWRWVVVIGFLKPETWPKDVSDKRLWQRDTDDRRMEGWRIWKSWRM